MLIWGSVFVITKAAMREIPPLTLAALRFLIASAVLIPMAARRGGFQQLPRPLPFASLALMGFTGIAIYYPGFNYALVYASASQGALVFALLPAAVAVAAVLALGERMSRRRVMGIALSVCGVAVLVATGEREVASPRPLVGAVCMLGAVIAWTVYTVIAKRLAHADQVVVIACVSVLGLLMLLPFTAWELLHVPRPNPSLSAWAGALFLGVVASAVSYTIYSYVLRELEASLVGVFINLDPIIGVALAVLVLDEALHPWQVVGAVVALVGMWIASTGEVLAKHD